MELDVLIERTQQIRDALPLPNIKQRLVQAAQELSRAGDEQTHVELLNEAVAAVVTVLYATDGDGRLANIDARTHRILIPVPWGKSGWKRWGGMREWESTILRKILLVRAEMRRQSPVFELAGGQWFLDYQTYPTAQAALTYWKQHPIVLREWRIHADMMRQQARERMSKRHEK